MINNVTSQMKTIASASGMRQRARSTVLAPVILLTFLWGSPAFAQDKEPSVARGAQAWSQHCMRCHNPRSPGELADPEWEVSMMHMRVIANIPGGMARDILKFLQESDGKTFEELKQ